MKRSNTSLFLLFLLVVSSLARADEIMSLESFLDQIESQNLDLKVEIAKENSAEAKSIGVALPPPMVGVNQMREDDGHVSKGFELSQSIPFPTKLSSDHSARKYEAESQKEAHRGRAKEILAQGKLLYFCLWQLQERLSLLEEKKSVIQDHIKLSRSTVRSDSFAAIHLLKAESDLDLLGNEIEAAKQKIREKQSEVAIFLNADPGTFKITAIEPPLSEIPRIDSIDETHQIKALTLNLEHFKSREFEAKSAWLPDFNIRYKQMSAPSTSPAFSEIMVGVSLPFVFFWEPYSATQSARAERSVAEYELAKQKRMIESDKITLLSRVTSLKEQLKTLKEKLIPRAEKRMKLVHNLAPRDMETLQDHRETMEAFPDLKMKALELRLEYETAIASLEKYSTEKDSSHE